MYLRCLTDDRPRRWLRWLPWAEYTYNTAFHTALQATPLKVVYGRDPPSICSYVPNEIRVVVAQNLAERDEFLQDVRLRLEQAQQVAKQQYERGAGTALSPSRLGIGCGCAFIIALMAPWHRWLQTNSARDILGHIKLLRSSMTSHSALLCPRARACMMCSMLAC
jgi:hypothetical protein